MTLEDDVESMLSEQFNASNESMFRIRPGIGGTQALGGGGDSTYRGEDSVFGYDEDKGLISESDDGGWYASDRDAARNAGLKGGAEDNDFDDISEHSSDDVSDSDPEAEGQGSPKKTKKTKGEKRKKKRKKAEAEAQAGAGAGNAEITKAKEPDAKKLVQTYK